MREDELPVRDSAVDPVVDQTLPLRLTPARILSLGQGSELLTKKVGAEIQQAGKNDADDRTHADRAGSPTPTTTVSSALYRGQGSVTAAGVGPTRKKTRGKYAKNMAAVTGEK